MTSPQQQAVRRRELYGLPIPRLQQVYARLSGHLVHEVRADWPAADPRTQRVLVDLIVGRENH